MKEILKESLRRLRGRGNLNKKRKSYVSSPQKEGAY